MEQHIFDVAVIGGGPGGYVSAIRASQLGLRVLLVEKEHLGGTCLNCGCIPTKAMLADASLYYRLKESPVIGADNLGLDMAKLVERKDGVVKTLRSGVDLLLKNNGIIFVKGKAKLVNPRTVEVEEEKRIERFSASNIIIATGSVPSQPRSVDVDGKTVLTSTDILDMSSVPAELIIIGGGYMGMEFACLFNALGSRVTVIEMLPRVLATEDEEIVRALVAVLKKRGIKIFTETIVKEAGERGSKAEVVVIDRGGKEEVLKAEKVLVAAGRQPFTEGLALESLNVAMDGAFIRVNEKMETNVSGVYAIGDVTGRQLLAHKASAEGIAAAENAAGGKSRVDYSKIPSCIFTFPEIASIGLTEKQAREKGIAYVTGRFPFASSGRALASGTPEGLVKVVADKEIGQVIGIHILCEHATELIGGATLAMALEATIEELGRTIQAHPTLSEAIAEAALDAKGEAIHLPKRRR